MEQLDFSLNRLYLHSEGSRDPLRIGILLDDTRIPRYVAQIIRDIRASQFATLAAVVLPKSRGTLPGHSRVVPLLLRAYLRFVDAQYRRTPHPLDPESATELLGATPDLPWLDTDPPSQPLDILLYFGAQQDPRSFAHLAAQGIWTLDVGTVQAGAFCRPLIADLMGKAEISQASLVQVDAQGNRVPLQRIWLSPTSTPSLSEHEFNIYWGVQHTVIQALRRLHEQGVARHPEAPAVATQAPHPTRPIDNLSVARWIVPLMARKVVRHYVEGREKTHWKIAVRRSTVPLFETPDAAAVATFNWLHSPSNQFWADPFLFAHDGATWLFFESVDYAVDRGVIACGRLNDRGAIEDVRTVLDRPYHLSYPHVFAHDGAVWMIPETAQSGRVELYRARAFPGDWQLEATLLELRCVDATPFQHAGRWWMFASPMPVDSHAPTTLLFCAPALTGPWRLHPANPAVADVRRARSAGRVIDHAGRLIRPSQDCASTYGYALNFSEVRTLTSTHYSERPLATISPAWVPELRGLHTYNRAGDWETIDGKIYIRESDL